MNARSVSTPDTIESIVDQCVKCGLCLPHCPTYRLTGNEIESPRGRLELMRLATQHTSAALHTHDALAHCLACGQCEYHCPIQVPYLSALTQSRQLAHMPRHWSHQVLASPRLLAWLIGVASSLPLWLRRRLPLGRALIGRPNALPPFAHIPSANNTHNDLALLPGCTGQALDRAAINAVIQIAAALGHSITLLPAQCCGSLHKHTGDLETATVIQSALRTTLKATGDATIVHLNTGCDLQIRTTAGIAERSTMTVTQWLSTQSESLRFRRNEQRVALHHPCTSTQSERQSLERLLRRIPGLDIHILDQHAGCCGAAGDQFLRDPERASAFMARWRDAYTKAEAPIILSSNIGCSLQLSNQESISATILHPVVFLASLLEPSA